MSKKLAAGADKFVLDVKVGTGALMEKYEDGIKLAKLMCKIGELSGHETVCYITNMNRPRRLKCRSFIGGTGSG